VISQEAQMLSVALDQVNGVLVLTPNGKLRSSDFTEAAAPVDRYFETHRQLNGVLVVADQFPGWEDIPAFSAHLHFVKERQDRIKRVALVSDSALLKVVPEVARFLVRPEVRHFASGERSQALAWLVS
jgi:hypothetical protein